MSSNNFSTTWIQTCLRKFWFGGSSKSGKGLGSGYSRKSRSRAAKVPSEEISGQPGWDHLKGDEFNRPDFGPNTALVQEVLSRLSIDHFCRSLIRGELAIESRRFELVDDLLVADRLSSQQDLWDEGYADWIGVKETTIAAAYIPRSPIVPHIRQIREYLDRYRRLLEQVLRQAIIARWSGDRFARTLGSLERMSTAIAADIGDICLARLQFGVGYEPFETMFWAYRQGGWPCGWKGEYPDGKMVVYHIGPKV